MLLTTTEQAIWAGKGWKRRSKEAKESRCVSCVHPPENAKHTRHAETKKSVGLLQVEDETQDGEQEDKEGPEELCGDRAVRVDDLENGNEVENEDKLRHKTRFNGEETET